MGLFDFFRTADINNSISEYRTTNGAVLLDVRTAANIGGINNYHGKVVK